MWLVATITLLCTIIMSIVVTVWCLIQKVFNYIMHILWLALRTTFWQWVSNLSLWSISTPRYLTVSQNDVTDPFSLRLGLEGLSLLVENNISFVLPAFKRRSRSVHWLEILKSWSISYQIWPIKFHWFDHRQNCLWIWHINQITLTPGFKSENRPDTWWV